MHHHDACPRSATLHRPETASGEVAPLDLIRMVRRLAGFAVLLLVLPVFLLGMAVAMPIALLVGGVDGLDKLWRTAGRQLRAHHVRHQHAHL